PEEAVLPVGDAQVRPRLAAEQGQIVGRDLEPQPRHRPREDFARPAAAERLVRRRRRVGELDLRLDEVEVPAALLGPRAVVLVGQEVGERAQEVGAELSLVRGDGAEEFALEERAEEPLREVLRGLDVVAAAADVEVDRLPVDGDQPVERVAGAVAGLADDGPGGGLESEVVAADGRLVGHSIRRRAPARRPLRRSKPEGEAGGAEAAPAAEGAEAEPPGPWAQERGPPGEARRRACPPKRHPVEVRRRDAAADPARTGASAPDACRPGGRRTAGPAPRAPVERARPGSREATADPRSRAWAPRPGP